MSHVLLLHCSEAAPCSLSYILVTHSRSQPAVLCCCPEAGSPCGMAASQLRNSAPSHLVGTQVRKHLLASAGLPGTSQASHCAITGGFSLIIHGKTPLYKEIQRSEAFSFKYCTAIGTLLLLGTKRFCKALSKSHFIFPLLGFISTLSLFKH